ncbi:MAG: FTR1 family protein [Bryobacteraceae bacterium]
MQAVLRLGWLPHRGKPRPGNILIDSHLHLKCNGFTLLQNRAAREPAGNVPRPALRRLFFAVLWIGGFVLAAVLIREGFTGSGIPDPVAPHSDATAAVLDIGVLVFREGLECILVLAAVTAGMVGSSAVYRRPVAAGAGVAALATLITWRIAIGVIDDLSTAISSLAIQAATGLLAIIVLLVVMNWFFHKLYWTGWISLHTKKKQELLQSGGGLARSKTNLWWGLAVLGFTSLYREGFEVVLFLQSYRLRLGAGPIRYGVLLGVFFSGIVAVLTFMAHRRLPYRRMLVLTGVMLGGVLLVMVGEQAQEMQLAHWLPKTDLPRLAKVIPSWMGLWFSIFPTVETLTAQAAAGLLVLGSYFAARLGSLRTAKQQ